MPNGVLNVHSNASSNNVKQQFFNDNKYHTNGTLKRHGDKNGRQDDLPPQHQQQQPQQQPNSILNVAEMLLHGVADREILEIWLRSFDCLEFVKKFIDAGYDMPTISRVTPQDLTAIGITDPAKRSKIISEIKKLNLQDGIPNYKPASLSHWLALLRLDNSYYKSLCDQNLDTIEKVCQLTWEDFEELGITKLGHQKRLLLAIERLKDIDTASLKNSKKNISEPIYDTNSSQILLVASSENHSINGPIINKQSSTSELSSTGSGSMHSIYSASSHHQQNSNNVHQLNNNVDTMNSRHNQQQAQAQTIYSQPPPQMFQNQPNQHQKQNAQNQTYIQFPQAPPLPPPNLLQQQHQQNQNVNNFFNTMANPSLNQNTNISHNQPSHTQFGNLSSQDDSQRLGLSNGNNTSFSNTVPQKQHYQMNRQSLNHLPFAALANLPRHQQQLLQQSSIYATLSRQPQRIKQPPPPVPIRTNSLKSNSLIDEEDNRQRNEQLLRNGSMTSSTTSSPQRQPNFNNNVNLNLFRTGSRLNNRSQFNSQSLQKNKSFSGNAYMEAARARFLNRNNSQIQQPLYAAGVVNQLTQDMSNCTDNFFKSNATHIGHQNATTGRDDDFPPPPSPLSLTDFDGMIPLKQSTGHF